MTNFFYYDTNGQKFGPVNSQQLRALVTQKIITPQTPMETDAGHKGLAGQIPGLFTAPAPFDPFATATPQTTPRPIQRSDSTSLMDKIKTKPVIFGGITAVVLLLLFGGVWVMSSASSPRSTTEKQEETAKTSSDSDDKLAATETDETDLQADTAGLRLTSDEDRIFLFTKKTVSRIDHNKIFFHVTFDESPALAGHVDIKGKAIPYEITSSDTSVADKGQQFKGKTFTTIKGRRDNYETDVTSVKGLKPGTVTFTVIAGEHSDSKKIEVIQTDLDQTFSEKKIMTRFGFPTEKSGTKWYYKNSDYGPIEITFYQGEVFEVATWKKSILGPSPHNHP